MTRSSPAGAWVFAVLMIIVAAGASWWRIGLRNAAAVSLPTPSGKAAQARYPMPESLPVEEGLTQEVLSALVQANPFSPERRYVPEPVSRMVPAPSAPAQEQAMLRFKGLIQLGTRQRAIIEDVGGKKTHFLELGQEVAGYKVLDISEAQVLLSDVNTDEGVTLFRSSESSPAKIRGAGAQ